MVPKMFEPFDCSLLPKGHILTVPLQGDEPLVRAHLVFLIYDCFIPYAQSHNLARHITHWLKLSQGQYYISVNNRGSGETALICRLA